MNSRIPVGVLGATGPVGQKLVALLKEHPYFQLTHIYSSERNVGKSYCDAISHRLFEREEDLSHALDMKLLSVENEDRPALAFSSLVSSAAKQIEPDFVNAGVSVCSNASAYRMDKCVPIILADVNPEHLQIINKQEEVKGWKGYLVTNSNCSTSGIVTALAPLVQFGIQSLSVATYQALSGAGHPGHSAQSMLGNVYPYIKDEEEKIAAETRMMLSKCEDAQLIQPDFPVEAFCARVPVSNGHLISVTVGLGSDVDCEKIRKSWNNWSGKVAGLPSAPQQVIKHIDNDTRPQPRYDLMREAGFAVTTGRLRRVETGRFSFVVLVHNLVRGAAGAALLNGELLVREGYVKI